jgi:hypothetical protein
LEYFMAIMDMSPCPYFNTQIKNIEATSFLTQGGCRAAAFILPNS